MKLALSDVSSVRVEDDHDAEGALYLMSTGNILHIYRQDPGTSGDHVGNGGKIVKREFNVTTETWGTISDVFSDEYDDRNIHGGVTSTGRFVLFFRRYNATTSSTVDINFMYSDDDGATWSSRTSVALGHSGASPYGDMIEIPGEGYMMGFQDNYYVEVLFSTDGSSWGSGVVVGDYQVAESYRITETSFAHLGNNKIIALSRDNNGGMLYQMVSEDDGQTWGTPVRTNIACETFTVSPIVLYVDNQILVLAPDRGSAYGDKTLPNEGISFYVGDPNVVLNSPDAYEYRDIVLRPQSSSDRVFYGYPTISLVARDKYLVVFSDGEYRTGGENISLYQFYLTIKTTPTIGVKYGVPVFRVI